MATSVIRRHGRSGERQSDRAGFWLPAAACARKPSVLFFFLHSARQVSKCADRTQELLKWCREGGRRGKVCWWVAAAGCESGDFHPRASEELAAPVLSSGPCWVLWERARCLQVMVCCVQKTNPSLKLPVPESTGYGPPPPVLPSRATLRLSSSDRGCSTGLGGSGCKSGYPSWGWSCLK